MRFFVVGLGSMGKRRIRNLLKLGERDVVGYDVNWDRLREAQEKYGIRPVGSVEEGLAEDPDLMVISVPPMHHSEYALKAVEVGVPFFCESPLARTSGEVERLIEASEESGVLGAPSCNMLFNAGVKRIFHMVGQGQIGRVLCVQYEVGHYLPDWHPYEDYRTTYMGEDPIFGGGADLVPMELVWLTKLFGRVRRVTGLMRDLRRLEIRAPHDTFQMVMETERGVVVEFHADGVSRDPCRRCRVVGEEGTIVWDGVENYVKFYSASEGSWTVRYEPRGFVYTEGYSHEKMYEEEFAHLLRVLRGEEEYRHGLGDELHILRIWEAALRSSEQGVRTEVAM